MKFIHAADIHIGSWRDDRMKLLSYEVFNNFIKEVINEKPDFLIISGDLFHTAIPPIEALRIVVSGFELLKKNNIPIYIIEGSHDFSPSNKSMISVLEAANLVINVSKGIAINNKLRLEFTIDKKTGVKITGIKGKKGSLDSIYYEDLELEYLEKEEGDKIFLFHSTINEMKGIDLKEVEGIPISFLPKKFNYYAGGHLHIIKDYNDENYKNVIYPGPLFPTTFSELEKLRAGFYIVVNNWIPKRKKIEIKNILVKKKDVSELSIANINQLLDDFLEEIQKDDIVLLKLTGKLNGSRRELNIDDFIKKAYEKGAYFVMLNTYQLINKEMDYFIKNDKEINVEEIINNNIEGIFKEEKMIIKELIKILGQEIKEGEKRNDYEKRILEESKKILRFFKTL